MALDSINNLTSLNLYDSNEHFINLPEFAFKNSKHLKELKLNLDKAIFNKNHFHGLENLEILYFGHLHNKNFIKFGEEIDNLPNLKELFLVKVEFDEKFSLKGFEDLEVLSLNNVVFTEKTPKDLFKNLKNLKKFHYSKRFSSE